MGLTPHGQAQGNNTGSATGREPGPLVERQQTADTALPVAAAVGEFSLDCFPIYYPDGFDRSSDDLRQGESTVTIWFGPSFENPRPQGRDHHAIDIMAPIGLPVYFSSAQTVVNEWNADSGARSGVTDASDGGRGGNSVRTIDQHGYVHYYAHLRDPSTVRTGQTYAAGHLLGYSGNTGAARGNAHLHYQVRAPRPLPRPNRYTMEIVVAGQSTYFQARGRGPVNPFSELVRLGLEKNPPARRRGRHSEQYDLPIPLARYILNEIQR